MFTNPYIGVPEKWFLTILGSISMLITLPLNIEADVGTSLHSITPLVKISATPENVTTFPSVLETEVMFLSLSEESSARYLSCCRIWINYCSIIW